MTSDRTPVYIEGVALEMSWRDGTRNLSDLIFSVVDKAIQDTGRGIDGIDSVVLGAHDLVDGRSLSSMVTAPAAGAYLRDETRFSDDGAAAFAGGVTRIEAGESQRCIVAAWARASEHDVLAVSRVLFDPFFGRPMGLHEFDVSAMRAQAWIQQGGDVEPRAAALARRQQAARRNPRALHQGGMRIQGSYPLQQADLPLWADVVVAAVLSVDKSAVRVAGFGQSSEPYWIGDRSMKGLPAVQKAARAAFDDAGISPADLGVVEVDGLSLFDEAMTLEACGIAEEGQGMRALAGDPRCNASGGMEAGYCAPAMGLVRIVEAALQLQGRAGAVQGGRAHWGLATGSSVVAGQTQTAVILEAV